LKSMHIDTLADMDSDAELRRTVEHATFLTERMKKSRRSRASHQDYDSVSDGRLRQWRAAIGPPGSDWLEKRLRWEGLDPETVHSVFNHRALNGRARLPPWAVVLRNISIAAQTFNPSAVDASPLDGSSPVPFEDLLLPAVMVARAMLCERLNVRCEPLSFPIAGLISGEAYRALERGLLKQLSSISGQALEVEFRASLPYGQSLLVMLGASPIQADGDMQYRRFVRHHLDNGWRELTFQYPVLGRLIATAVEFWADATRELIQRLITDSAALIECFHLNDRPLEIRNFGVSLSDRHRNGRSVVIIEFGCGTKVVYKPKPLSSEAAFNHLLSWLNERGISPELRVVTVFDRGEYGWVEHIEHLPCADESSARQFYLRAGMLACVLHVLRATDCHYENVIAHGEHPVLIDAETLLYPEPQPLEVPSQTGVAGVLGADRLADSVLRTGLLPRWQSIGEATVHDTSGLGCTTDQTGSRKILRWTGINTDAMHMRYEEGLIKAAQNVARLAGRTLSPGDYETELVSGFAQTYRLFLKERDSLTAERGPLALMQRHKVRFMYRPTSVYSTLMTASWTPEVLRDGIAYGIHFEQLARAFLTGSDKPPLWPVLAAEIRAMEQMDVPLFMASADRTDLDPPNCRSLPDAFKDPSYDRTIQLISAMSETELGRQLAIIRAALQTTVACTPTGVDVDLDLVNLRPASLLDRSDLVREAVAIGEELERQALPDGEGGVNWIGLNYLEGCDRFQLDVLNDSLYEGCCGIALFLAALSTVTGNTQFAQLALRTLHSTRARLRRVPRGSRSAAARLRGLGAGSGLGSLIYSFVRTAVLLSEDDGLVEEASSLAEWVTSDVIAADERLDVLGGAAGGLLGLLALYSVTHEETVLQRAVECGDHLLQQRIPWRAGRPWRTISNHPLTGFSHGAAGIAYSLVRLYGVTGNSEYLSAAIQGIEFERFVFSERQGNWPDFRQGHTNAEMRFPIKWCHGAAGLGLARLGCRNIANISGIDREITTALRTTRERYLQATDFLCCGNFGRAETFLVAADVLDQPEWRRVCETGVAAVVARASMAGHYRLFARAGLYNPGFFQGTAGIGYQLLRLAHNELPSVLLWE
jgi:type 2 lantibiotic biosynthesis protein LanM